MTLMNRIRVTDWLSKDHQDKLAHIRKLQSLRIGDQATARTAKGRLTTSAVKNLKKRGKDPEAAAKAALAKLTPEQLAALTARLG